jgi:hypothetical protein
LERAPSSDQHVADVRPSARRIRDQPLATVTVELDA